MFMGGVGFSLSLFLKKESFFTLWHEFSISTELNGTIIDKTSSFDFATDDDLSCMLILFLLFSSHKAGFRFSLYGTLHIQKSSFI